MTVFTSVSWHADACELSSSIDAGSLILTRIAVTLIDVNLAPRSGIALWASALVGTRSVYTNTFMFTRSRNSSTLIYVLLACGA